MTTLEITLILLLCSSFFLSVYYWYKISEIKDEYEILKQELDYCKEDLEEAKKGNFDFE